MHPDVVTWPSLFQKRTEPQSVYYLNFYQINFFFSFINVKIRGIAFFYYYLSFFLIYLSILSFIWPPVLKWKLSIPPHNTKRGKEWVKIYGYKLPSVRALEYNVRMRKYGMQVLHAIINPFITPLGIWRHGYASPLSITNKLRLRGHCSVKTDCCWANGMPRNASALCFWGYIYLPVNHLTHYRKRRWRQGDTILADWIIWILIFTCFMTSVMNANMCNSREMCENINATSLLPPKYNNLHQNTMQIYTVKAINF